MFFNTWYTSSLTSDHVTHYRSHHNYHHSLLLKSSSPSATYMRRGIGSALVQIMACCLFDSKPISKPMLAIVNWTVRNKLQWFFLSEYKIFHSQKMHPKISPAKWRPLCPSGDELIRHGCGVLPCPFVSILEAMLTVSPNKQKRGIVRPTTPTNYTSVPFY